MTVCSYATIRNFFFVTFLALMYMGISASLINFNKYLMRDDRFPFALFLGMIHMTFSFSFNGVLLQVAPSMYPSLTDPQQKISVDFDLVAKILVPIATCFAAQIVLSNMAFMHSSVTMLQMMKQSNVVFVYLFSLALNLEVFCPKRAGALTLIFLATCLTVHGEVAFSWTGFLLQAVSMFCESMKLTLQSHSLSASGRRLDAFTYVTLVAPLVFVVLILWLVAFGFFWPGRPVGLMLPPWEALYEFKWILMANGCLAFAMQIAHAAFMKSSSAITFILAGVVMKDIVIVSICTVVLKEPLSVQQAIGFSLQLAGVLFWSKLKAAPSNYDPPPLPRGSTGLIAACHPDNEPVRDISMEKSEDINPFIPRITTNSSDSTAATQDDDYDEERELEMLEGI